MAHEVEQMFSVSETPWHGLGRIIREAPTTEEAIRLAGLDWRVEERPVFIGRGADGNLTNMMSTGAIHGITRVPSHKALLRGDTQAVLGVVGKDYTPLQNDRAFAFFDKFLGAGECSLETAGCLRDGKRVWVLAALNRDPVDVTGKGDLVRKFLLLSNGHDGSMAVRVGFTPIRVVCANTLAMAHDSGESALVRIAHGRNVELRLDQVRDLVNAANASFEATAEQYRSLAATEVNAEDLDRYVRKVFRVQDPRTPSQVAAWGRLRDNVVGLFESGRGNDMPGTRGTYWAAYNAVTEHLSYGRRGTNESRLNSLWFGEGRGANAHALATALDMAEAA